MAGLRRAVIIGVDKYTPKSENESSETKPEIKNLSGAVQDATEIYRILTRPDNFGRANFTIPDKHFLTNERATADSIRAAISDVFYRSEQRCEIALLYFAGHGRKDYLDYGWLLPHDCDHESPFVRGIRIQELKQLFLNPKLNIDTGIMILDCCYSGIATLPDGVRGSEDALDSFQKEWQLESTGSGRFILASARANETAREIKRKHAFSDEEHVHGAFSFHLIEGLETGASDKLGCVSLGELIKYVDSQFKTSDAKHKPQHYGVGGGEFGIEIARRHEKFKEELDKRYNEIDAYLRDYIRQKSVKTLMAAVDVLDEIGSRGDQDRTDKYLADIQQLFGIESDRVARWWMRNFKEMLRQTDNSVNYRKVDEVLPTADLGGVRKDDSGLVVQVMDIILRGLDFKPEQLPDSQSVQSVVRNIRIFDRESETSAAIKESTAVTRPRASAVATGAPITTSP